MTTRFSASDDWEKLEFLLVAVGAALVTGLVSAMASNPTWSLVPSLAAMGWLAYRTFSKAHDNDQDSASLEHFADWIYLLGYMLTLVAIFGIVPRLDGSSTTDLLHAGAFKLATTIAGLVIMLVFKEIARLWQETREQAIAAEYSALNSRLKDTLEGLSTLTEEFRLRAGDLLNLFDPVKLATMANATQEFNSQLEEAGQSLTDLKKTLGVATKAVAELAPPVKNSGAELVALGAAFSELRANAVGPLAGQMTALTAATGAAQTSFSSAARGADATRDALEALGRRAKEEETQLRALRESFSALRDAHSELANRARALLDVPRTTPDSPLGALRATIEIVGTRFDSMDSQLRALAAQLTLPAWGDAVRKLDAAATGLSASAGELSEGIAALPAASSLDVQPVAKTAAEVQNSLQQLTTLMERLDGSLKSLGTAIADRPATSSIPAPIGFWRRLFTSRKR